MVQIYKLFIKNTIFVPKLCSSMKRLTVLLCILLLGLFVQAQTNDPVRIAFWNMENFFDPYVDSTKTYNAFTEDGMQHWTKTRFYRKRNNMYKAILAMSENRPLGILGMCEVENECAAFPF